MQVRAEDAYAAAATGRRELADLLESLTDDQLNAPSLCAGWSVRVVGAHVAAAISVSKTRFLLSTALTGFSFNRTNSRLAHEMAKRPMAELVATLRARADTPVSPPVVGPSGPMTDVIVHTGDICLALRLPFDPPATTMPLVLDFLSGRAPGFVGRNLLRGLQLKPVDLDRTWGSGEPVVGRAADIAMAVCGRRSATTVLTGAGAELLRARL